MRPATGLAVTLLGIGVASLASAQTIQDQAPRPPPLPPQTGCELWRGTASGNDPSALVELRLCPTGNRVSGALQWSSTRSGWNRRSCEGEWDAGHTHLALRDLAIVEQRPQPGWMFCTVDRYELSRAQPGRLEGRYDSAACNDHATMSLLLVSTGEPAPTDALPTPSPTGPPSPPVVPPRTRAPGGCASGCGIAGLTGVLVAVAGRRRRRA